MRKQFSEMLFFQFEMDADVDGDELSSTERKLVKKALEIAYRKGIHDVKKLILDKIELEDLW